MKKVFAVVLMLASFCCFANKTEVNKHYLSKIIDIKHDDIRLVIDEGSGSFGIFAIPEQGDEIPLLSTFDSFSSSFFTLKIGSKIYKLVHGSGLKVESTRTATGAQLAYLIKGKAQVVVDFTFMPSIASSTRDDMIKVTVYTINLSKSMQIFELKGTFDTILGENTHAHFSTAANSHINTETQFLSMSDDLWVRSANKDAAIQFLLHGRGITTPKSVSLGNKESMLNSAWVPQIQNQKSFTSVMSYNNSALAVNWPEMYIDSLNTESCTFYISVATDGNIPAGKKFLTALEIGKTAFPNSEVELENVQPKKAPVPEATELTEKEIEEAKKPAETIVTEIPVDQDRREKEEIKQEIVVSKEQLDPQYIQDLLDHIAALENEEGAVDSQEIKRLNAELDAIFDELRK